MKPVYQTKHGNEGDCWAACLASILEIPIQEIPDFSFCEDQDEQMFVTNEWLMKEYGITIVSMDAGEWPGISVSIPVYHIVTGKYSGSDIYHAVVAFDGKVIHDPGCYSGVFAPISNEFFVLMNPSQNKNPSYPKIFTELTRTAEKIYSELREGKSELNECKNT